jgi:hypothetical protein
MTVLMNEGTAPCVRDVLTRLISSAATADFAVAHVRLAAVNLSAEEAAGISDCRFLLGRLDAGSLPTAAGVAVEPVKLLGLRRLIAANRIRIRSTGMASWTPDFSVFRGLPSPGRPDVCVLGAHYFASPPASSALTCVMDEPRAVAMALRRFESLWRGGHDVAGVVIDSIDRLLDGTR